MAKTKKSNDTARMKKLVDKMVAISKNFDDTDTDVEKTVDKATEELSSIANDSSQEQLTEADFFSQTYKIADLPYTFLTRKQLGKYTIFTSGDCEIKINTDSLNKNSSIVKTENFSQCNMKDLEKDMVFRYRDPKDTSVVTLMKVVEKPNGKTIKVKTISGENQGKIINMPIEDKIIKIGFSENNWQEKLVSNINAEIEKQGLGEKLTANIDNTGSVVLANVETDDEFIVEDDTDFQEVNKFLQENGLVLDETNMENFSTINFGLGNWLEKVAVNGLKNIASKGQQKALMAVYLGYAIKRYEQALGAINATIEVAPTGVVQGHLRRMLLNGEMPKGLSKLSDCPTLKGLTEYQQVLQKVANKLDKDAAVQAYNNAKELDDQMVDLIKQGNELDKAMSDENVDNKSDVGKIGESNSDTINEYMQELAKYKEKNPKLEKLLNSDDTKRKLAKMAKGHWDKETFNDIWESNSAKSNMFKLGVITDMGNGKNKELNELYTKLSKAISASQKTKETVDGKETEENDNEGKSENMNASYKGFSETLTDITNKFVTNFDAKKVKDSDFGLVWEDRFGSLWSENPDESSNATLLWESADGKEVPAKQKDDNIMSDEDMDNALGMDSDEESGEGEDDFDFGDDKGSESEGDDDFDLDFGDEEGGGDESDEESFSEDDDFDLGFDDEEDESSEDEDFDFDDEEELEEDTSKGNPDVQKAMSVMKSMFDKLADIAQNK